MKKITKISECGNTVYSLGIEPRLLTECVLSSDISCTHRSSEDQKILKFQVVRPAKMQEEEKGNITKPENLICDLTQLSIFSK